ncbi:MAG: Anthranilate phosphoribosyltransferase [Alphaproteobacteria bacterium MarineAlpha5_Bin8]|nr:MAG: Anthranilate phosphoribosyltransferase [Alphaproteobacteria bacterium MarineAlpha5_Bin7]PPR46576.1 MAG: Anthranilate phosphoribosyltransferase [Alphaproteobacteria bacterium MarineAlpha5_Bin8]|tara:strand:- start:2583 stop:3587 length:1005 start_codon:yes stop_codon:yes gene_type:complete
MDKDSIKNKLFNRNDLTESESSLIFNLIMNGEISEIETTSILIALKIKNESKNEILGAAKVMREKSLKIKSPLDSIDTCGTGGDMKGTLNISTCSALIAASAGAKVAKHGNRSVSSQSGSADLLEKLGIKIFSEKSDLENSLNKFNFCFLFAQFHHSAMKHVANVRKQLGTRTIFNLLGPLTNPASTRKQLLGVFEKKWVNIHCEVLKELGSYHSIVVHGFDGLDEISLSGPSYISELKDGTIKDYIFDPKDFGYEYIKNEEIIGKDAEYNARAFIELLDAPNNSFQKIVEINSGAAIYLAGISKSLKEGFELAQKTILNKNAKNYFENMIKNQ